MLWWWSFLGRRRNMASSFNLSHLSPPNDSLCRNLVSNVVRSLLCIRRIHCQTGSQSKSHPNRGYEVSCSVVVLNTFCTHHLTFVVLSYTSPSPDPSSNSSFTCLSWCLVECILWVRGERGWHCYWEGCLDSLDLLSVMLPIEWSHLQMHPPSSTLLPCMCLCLPVCCWGRSVVYFKRSRLPWRYSESWWYPSQLFCLEVDIIWMMCLLPWGWREVCLPSCRHSVQLHLLWWWEGCKRLPRLSSSPSSPSSPSSWESWFYQSL